MVSEHVTIRLELFVTSAVEFPKVWEYVYCSGLMFVLLKEKEELGEKCCCCLIVIVVG
jgi:hypothetical protein